MLAIIYCWVTDGIILLTLWIFFTCYNAKISLRFYCYIMSLVSKEATTLTLKTFDPSGTSNKPKTYKIQLTWQWGIQTYIYIHLAMNEFGIWSCDQSNTNTFPLVYSNVLGECCLMMTIYRLKHISFHKIIALSFWCVNGIGKSYLEFDPGCNRQLMLKEGYLADIKCLSVSETAI